MTEQLQNQLQDNSQPLVTVAMPVYNAGKYLRLAVLSIVKQTFKNWELLIIDDGSTDNALDSIADIQDGRIRILRDGENKGLAARLNEAIDLAHGQYLARMDQDDVSYPERFERQVHALQNEHELDLVAVRAITISGNNQLTGLLACDLSKEEISAKPWRGFYLPHPTWMGKIAWFRRYRYTTPGPYFCEDQELLLRSYDRSQFLMIMEPLFAYRLRDSINWRKLIKTRLTVLHIQLQHFVFRGQLSFAFMAVSTFFGRALMDLLKGVSSIAYPIIKIHDEEISTKWQDVLNFVEN
jgi:glycosyltransferase involved in cell wall biosynthesis